MYAIERQSEIMSLLGAKKSLSVPETAARFRVTEETIRRDLRALERQGLLVRTHGGALLPDDSLVETPLRIREGINTRGKDRMGAAAARLVQSGETVMLDASTSALYVAKHLKTKKSLTVITNAERIVTELADCPEITIVCTGGVLRRESRSYVGRAAESVIGSYYADHLFFSCKGFDPQTGLTDSIEEESALRRSMLTRARTRIFLCDHTKFGRVGFTTTATLSDLHKLITDTPLDAAAAAAVSAAGVEAIVAPPV
ncbi:MAG: DeoR/GlpR family DNA-binding transcription regulator [Clostridiaceae bacterium]|nr:DeoR/GlpR family DNA-binding transcription regulator [Clostridiaceae bacterium]MDY3285293.1 DeoR/GlpR family DNA-binding transcription regulator [Eubacteriales bacterium]MDY5016068.1 DeoR/GlpR family DNA-binding transcription regulator [Eubacteriales bacterium]